MLIMLSTEDSNAKSQNTHSKLETSVKKKKKKVWCRKKQQQQQQFAI